MKFNVWDIDWDCDKQKAATLPKKVVLNTETEDGFSIKDDQDIAQELYERYDVEVNGFRTDLNCENDSFGYYVNDVESKIS